MSRKSLTHAERATNVRWAADELPDAFRNATQAMVTYGPTDPRTLRAWAIVEAHGATIHRQSRILAGKSRGG